MFKYDYSLLKRKIIEIFESEENFAKALENSNVSMKIKTFESRINGNTYFKQSEIETICELLEIDVKEISKYFFTPIYELNSCESDNNFVKVKGEVL